MIKKTIACMLCAVFTILLLCSCGEETNTEIVGNWIPATASINGTTVQYSSLGIEEDQFRLSFEANSKCTVITTGITKKGSYVFNGSSIDIIIGNETKKLDYDSGTISLSLDYDNNQMQITFIREREE